MEPNLVQYIPIAVLLGIALFFALLLPILSLSLGPVSYTHLTLPTSDLV